MPKKLKKITRDITKVGLGLGIGAAVVSKAGVPSVTPAFGVAAKFVSPIVTAKIGLHALSIVKKGYIKKRKRR